MAAHGETYAFGSRIPAGLYNLNGKFYAEANETGLVVASVTIPVTVSVDGSLEKSDGSALGQVSFDGVIKSVQIAPGQSVSVGSTVQIVATAFDSQSNVVAVTPGSFSFSVSSGATFLTVTPDGIASGLTTGTAEVNATVDGQTSSNTAVTVNSPQAPPDFANPGFETPAISQGSYSEPPPSGFVWTGAPGFGVASGYGSWGTGAESGLQYAFLQSSGSAPPHAGTCEQTVAGFTVGQTYHVTFFMARRNGDVGGNDGAPVTLTANGQTIFPATYPTNDAAWNPYQSNSFTATQTSYDFIFSVPSVTSGDASTLLDEVHIAAG